MTYSQACRFMYAYMTWQIHIKSLKFNFIQFAKTCTVYLYGFCTKMQAKSVQAHFNLPMSIIVIKQDLPLANKKTWKLQCQFALEFYPSKLPYIHNIKI